MDTVTPKRRIGFWNIFCGSEKWAGMPVFHGKQPEIGCVLPVSNKEKNHQYVPRRSACRPNLSQSVPASDALSVLRSSQRVSFDADTETALIVSDNAGNVTTIQNAYAGA